MRAGSHLELRSPALEFVKATTYVMSLDGSLKEEVVGLKRVLLKKLAVREFGQDSVFRDPCLSYVLRDVICSYCSLCRDFDLLRDKALTADETATDNTPSATGVVQESNRWRCGNCHNHINREEIENRLLQEVERLAMSFLLQVSL